MRFEKWAGRAPAWRTVLKPVSVLMCVASLVACGGGDAQLQAPPAQGPITTTNRALDIAIVGDGMFALFDANRNEAVYSRYGKFDLDHEGRLVHASGALVVGRAAGAEASAVPVPLPAIARAMAPTATSRVRVQVNLDARLPVNGSVDLAGSFDPSDISTFQKAHSLTIYDALGNAQALTLYFQHGSTTDAWRVYPAVNGVTVGDLAGVALAFTPNGTVADGSGIFDLDVPAVPMFAGGVSEPLPGLVIDLSSSTAYAATFAVTAEERDGGIAGALSGVHVSSAGVITLIYDNGRARELGQMLLARFSIIDRLGALANQAWTCRQQCSLPTLEVPATQLLGALQAGALESPI